MECVASGTTTIPPGDNTGGVLETPVVSATDGTFTDKINVSWTASAGATRYEVWRGLTSSVSAAMKHADINGVTTYSDTVVDPGTVYYYFVRAFADPNKSSSFSSPDSGYAGTIAVTLPMVTDLVASKGFYDYSAADHVYRGTINLVWTAAVGAQTYDIYRNTTDDYTTATRIAQDLVPRNLVYPWVFPPTGVIVNNGPDLTYQHSVQSANQTDVTAVANYYFWVVAKRANPAAVSPFSNSNAGAIGWAIGQGGSFLPNDGRTVLMSGAAAMTVPALTTKAWVIVRGAAASGAGGNGSLGGGGGGHGAYAVGLMSVSATGAFRVVSTPEADPAGGAHDANGVDGPVTVLQYSAAGDFSDTIDVVTCAAPGKGLFNAAGGGLGGAGATAAVHASLTPSYILNGKAGFPAVTSTGGDSGYAFGFFKGPPAVEEAFSTAGNAQAGHAGGGSFYDNYHPLLAIGGKGVRGAALVVWYP